MEFYWELMTSVRWGAWIALHASALLLGAASYRPVRAALAEIGVEKELSWWEKLVIFLMFVAAGVLTLLALLVVTKWLALLLLGIGVILSLLATFWWLFGFVRWPWDKEFWENILAFYREYPFCCSLSYAVILGAIAALIVALLVASWWWVLIIGLAVAFWFFGVFYLCWLIVLWERIVWSIFLWIWKLFTRTLRVILQWLEKHWKKVTKRVEEIRTHTKKTCASWHWLIRWLCILWEYVKVIVIVVLWIVVTVAVLVLVTVIVLVTLFILLLVLVVVVLTVLVPRLVFICFARSLKM